MRKGLKILILLLAPLIFSALVCAAAPAWAKKHEKVNINAQTKVFKGSYFITMRPLILPVINEEGMQEIVSVVVALQVKSQRRMEQVSSVAPKLNDAYMRALYGKIGRNIYRNGQFIDVNKLKMKLASITEQLLGKDKVQDVLIQGITQRRFN